jgi:prepilin peptidase CpaA
MMNMMAITALLPYVPLLGLLVWAAATDLRDRRIPNWLTLGLVVSGLLRAGLFGPSGALSSAGWGLLAGASVPFLLLALDAVGGGDVKLLAGVGAWVGPGAVLAILMVEAVLGMGIVITQALIQGRTKRLFSNSAIVATNLIYMQDVGVSQAVETGKNCQSIDRPLPFAVPVLAATVLVLTFGWSLGR